MCAIAVHITYIMDLHNHVSSEAFIRFMRHCQHNALLCEPASGKAGGSLCRFVFFLFSRNCDFSGLGGVLRSDDLEIIGMLARFTLQIDFYGHGAPHTGPTHYSRLSSCDCL